MESFETTKVQVNIVRFIPAVLDVNIRFYFLEFDFRILDHLSIRHIVTSIDGAEIYQGKSLNDCIQFCEENEYDWDTRQ